MYYLGCWAINFSECRLIQQPTVRANLPFMLSWPWWPRLEDSYQVKKDRTHLSPSYSEQIALPFSTIMGAHPHSRWGPSVRYLGWLNYQGNIWQDGSVHWNLLVVVLVVKNFHCSGASLWVLNEKDCCRMSILTPTAHGAMLYSHSWLLRGIGKDCFLFVYVPNLYHTECWSTQMFCIPSWQEYLW